MEGFKRAAKNKKKVTQSKSTRSTAEPGSVDRFAELARQYIAEDRALGKEEDRATEQKDVSKEELEKSIKQILSVSSQKDTLECEMNLCELEDAQLKELDKINRRMEEKPRCEAKDNSQKEPETSKADCRMMRDAEDAEKSVGIPSRNRPSFLSRKKINSIRLPAPASALDANVQINCRITDLTNETPLPVTLRVSEGSLDLEDGSRNICDLTEEYDVIREEEELVERAKELKPADGREKREVLYREERAAEKSSWASSLLMGVFNCGCMNAAKQP